MSASLSQQEQVTELFNLAARDYNAALASPSARLLAPLFGFAGVEALAFSATQNARSSG
jgi:hypothetical protein